MIAKVCNAVTASGRAAPRPVCLILPRALPSADAGSPAVAWSGRVTTRLFGRTWDRAAATGRRPIYYSPSPEAD